MKIVQASAEILQATPGALLLIELAARNCYKSEGLAKGTEEAAGEFIRRKILHGDDPHLSVLEHAHVTVRFVVDRGVSHQLVRHRHTAISQESTRYCNYGKEKFGKEITVVEPCFFKAETPSWYRWREACEDAERAYFKLLSEGHAPEEARTVLPLSLKTEIVLTANFASWRHMFRARAARRAHPQMREVMIPLEQEFMKRFPAVFTCVR